MRTIERTQDHVQSAKRRVRSPRSRTRFFNWHVLFALLPLSSAGQDMLPELNMWRPNSHVLCIDVDSANNVAYIGGLFTSLTDPDPPFTTVTRNYVAAIDLSTGEPLPWNPDPDYHVYSLAHTASSVYLGGGFYNAGGLNKPGLVAVDKVAGLAQSWNPGMQPNVMTMTIAAGKLFVGGTFWQVAGASRNYAAAFDLSTGNLTNWNPSPNDHVRALQAMGNTIYVGGQFTQMGNGTPVPYLAGVDMNTGTTMSFVSEPNAPVWALAATGGRLYLGGEFTEVGGVPRSYAASLTGGSLNGWLPQPNAIVNALVGMGAQVAIGGNFISAGGQSSASRMVVVDAVSGTATSWNPAVNNSVSVIAASGGRILVGGVFSSAMQFPRSQFVSFTPAPPLVRVQPQVFLEGCYLSTLQVMHDSLRLASLVPQTEPYTDLGYSFTAEGSYGTIPSTVMANATYAAVVDWVVVELRDAVDPTVIVASKRGVLLRNGNVMDVNRVSPIWIPVLPGNYHVAVRHRNHLGVMTAAPMALSSISTIVNFTATGFAAYGTNAMNTVGARRVMWAGDATGNGEVKYVGANNDRDPILIAIGGSTPTNTVSNVYSSLDVNLDGVIKYVGSGNDRDPILTTVGGSTPTNTRVQQLP